MQQALHTTVCISVKFAQQLQMWITVYCLGDHSWRPGVTGQIKPHPEYTRV